MKSIIITGAAAGIGMSIAAMADAKGYRVGVLDVDASRVHKAVEQLTHGVGLVADVTDVASVKQAFSDFGTIDALINNAGILRTGPLIDHEPDDFKLVLDINLTGMFVAAQQAALVMRAQGSGAIINMSSINATHPSPNCGAYAAAKAGAAALTQQMSIEWGTYGIRVNAIAPGFIDAGMSTPFYADQKVRETRAQAVPLGRLGTAEDIAKAVLFLISDDATYISGQTLTVDGGVINSVLLQLPRE